MSHTQFKVIVFIFMALITYNLFRGLYFLVSGKGGGKNTARSLSWRIGLSVALFLILMALKLLGFIEPHNLNEVSPPASGSIPDSTSKKDEGKTLEEIQQQEDSSGGRIRLKE